MVSEMVLKNMTTIEEKKSVLAHFEESFDALAKLSKLN
jgi:hypothetical protein